MTHYFLRIYEANGAWDDTRADYPLDSAEVDSAWYVQHEGAAKVEIRRGTDQTVVKTVTP